MSDYLTAPEAAAYLKRSLPALYNLCNRGQIPYSRPSRGKSYFLKSDLDAFMGSNRRSSNAELADYANAMLIERR